MSKPKAPQAPDPRVVAGAQTQQNQQSAAYNAALNRTNTYGPSGSQEYSVTGTDPTTGAPIYRQDVKLDPQLERSYRGQLGQNAQLNEGAGGNLINQINGQQPFSLSGLPEMSTDFDALRKSQSDAVYGMNTAYLDPQFKQGEDALRSRMANQGIVEGSEASNNAVGDFNRSKDFAYGQARNQAVASGGAEADRKFNQQSQSRGQMMAEMMAQQNMPYQQLQQLRGLTATDLPQFQGQAQAGMAPADITSAMNNQYTGQVDSYNAKTNQRNANLSTAASIAAMFALSDERAKDDIQPVGELNDGTELFSFRYKGDDVPQVGVMAQRVEKTNPGAVRTRPDGLKEVNYASVLSRALRAA